MMKRMKKHKVKRERAEATSSYSRDHEEHDLAYYIHDRVELMVQVFSALKQKELRSITPACIQHLSIDNIKELCTEELLGISSKRLCAILDGAEPPSDTESSSVSQSPEHFETISLDSISSDEEILSQTSSKKSKKHKHKRRNSKSKKKKSKDASAEEADKSRASRAGLTVLELLELQARARAIRAQLQQEQATKQTETAGAESSQDHPSTDDDEVLVKEEPPEVVEISSDEEKPKIQELEEKQSTSKTTDETDETSQKVTKRINNLIITVPQAKPSRKIKLNRNKTVTVLNSTEKSITSVPDIEITAKSIDSEEPATSPKKMQSVVSNIVNTTAAKAAERDAKMKEKIKKKQKKKEKKKVAEKEGSDQDEIMLQLSDSEKLDLLEDLDRKNYDKVSSSSSEDSESSSSDSDDDHTENVSQNSSSHTVGDATNINQQNENSVKLIKDSSQGNVSNILHTTENDNNKTNKESSVESVVNIHQNLSKNDDVVRENTGVTPQSTVSEKKIVEENNGSQTEKETVLDYSEENENQKEKRNSINAIDLESNINEEQKECIIVDTSEDRVKGKENTEKDESSTQAVSGSIQSENNTEHEIDEKETLSAVETEVIVTQTEISKKNDDENTIKTDENEKEKGLSEGEISDHDSSEVEATELQPEVVCISDEEGSKSHKKKKKKEKKSKKGKKLKMSKDFRESSDQNFFEDNKSKDSMNKVEDCDDDIYEILELSDDSSCYEVEGTVLSKEPTAEEIEALSAKIDEIERVEVVTEEEIREHERTEAEKNENEITNEDLEKISWKDRYLDSKKVKRVLSTASIMNALRKKNKELKKKLEEAKVKEVNETRPIEEPSNHNLIEGSIEHYNTLEGSTKYVDPVTETVPEAQKGEETTEKEVGVTKEMKKDAKQLLKMYKRLLKYNDMNRKKDPSKKKKKKQKKKSKDDVGDKVATV